MLKVFFREVRFDCIVFNVVIRVFGFGFFFWDLLFLFWGVGFKFSWVWLFGGEVVLIWLIFVFFLLVIFILFWCFVFVDIIWLIFFISFFLVIKVIFSKGCNLVLIDLFCNFVFIIWRNNVWIRESLYLMELLVVFDIKIICCFKFKVCIRKFWGDLFVFWC